MCSGMAFEAGRSLVGTTLGIFQAQTEYTSSKRALDYNIAVLERNRAYKKMQAEDAEKRGQRAASGQRAVTRLTIGQQRAAQAGSGVVAGAGSGAIAQEQTQYYGDMDAMTLIANARREAYGHELQGINMLSQQALLTRQRGSLKFQRDLSIAGTLLGGATRFGSNMYRYYGGWGSSGESEDKDQQ